MTAPDVDPFADDPIERDRWGRPKIIPTKRGGAPNPSGKLVPYTRASTFADALMDSSGLAKWKQRHLALGLGRNPDLAALAGVYGPTLAEMHPIDKRALDDIIERAHDRSGGNAAADYGTAVHALTEPDPFGVVPERMAADVDSFGRTLERYGLEVVATEEFVVCDELKVAGTFDHLVRFTRDVTFSDGVVIPAGTVCVLDKKTGKMHPDTMCVQFAIYANAKHYEPVTGERTELGASFDYAVLAHIPLGEGETTLHRIDLRIGWAAAKLAGKVREHRTRKDIALDFPTSMNVDVPDLSMFIDSQDSTETSTVLTPAPDELEAMQADAAREPSPSAMLAGDHRMTTPMPDALEIPPITNGGVETVEPDPVATHPDGEPVDMADAVALVTTELDASPLPDLLSLIAAASTRDELAAVWRDNRTRWTPEATAAAQTRTAELTPKDDDW